MTNSLTILSSVIFNYHLVIWIWKKVCAMLIWLFTSLNLIESKWSQKMALRIMYLPQLLPVAPISWRWLVLPNEVVYTALWSFADGYLSWGVPLVSNRKYFLCGQTSRNPPLIQIHLAISQFSGKWFVFLFDITWRRKYFFLINGSHLTGGAI